MKIPNLFVVIPCYFDSENVEMLFKLFNSDERVNSWNSVNILIVDNSSGQDASARVLNRELSNRIKMSVVKTMFQSGHQHAILSGLHNVEEFGKSGDIVITMDGDGEDLPSDALTMAEDIRLEGGIAIAHRAGRKSSFMFKAGLSVYKLVYTTLTGVRFNSGNFAAFDYDVLKQIVHNPIFKLSYSGAIVTFPSVRKFHFARGARFMGESKMRIDSLIVHGLLSLIPQANKICSRMFMLFVLTLTASITFGVYGLYLKLFTQVATPVWTTTLLFGLSTVSGLAFVSFLVSLTLLSSIALSRANQTEDTKSLFPES